MESPNVCRARRILAKVSATRYLSFATLCCYIKCWQIIALPDKPDVLEERIEPFMGIIWHHLHDTIRSMLLLMLVPLQILWQIGNSLGCGGQ